MSLATLTRAKAEHLCNCYGVRLVDFEDEFQFALSYAAKGHNPVELFDGYVAETVRVNRADEQQAILEEVW